MTQSTMFRNEEKRALIEGWNEKFRARIRVPLEDVTVDTTFGQTHVLVAGPKDAPPMVVLHGALASAAHVVPELGPLVKSHRIYAVDVMGQSVKSADRRVELSDDSYGRWVVEVVDALGLDRFDLFGVSWGGFVSMRTVAVAGARIDRLVLLAPAGMVNNTVWAGLRDVGWPMLLYKMFPSDARFARVMSAIYTTLDPDWTAYFKDALDAYKMDMRVPPLLKPEDLASPKMPVLVIACEDDGSFPGEPLLARAKELFPQAEVEMIAGAKHCPPLDDNFRGWLANRVETFFGNAKGSTKAARRADAPTAS